MTMMDQEALFHWEPTDDDVLECPSDVFDIVPLPHTMPEVGATMDRQCMYCETSHEYQLADIQNV